MTTIVLIAFKFFLPIRVPNQRSLLTLVEQPIFQDQHIHLGTHEAAIRVLWGADDRVASHVKGGVHENGASCLGLKRLVQSVIARIRFLMNGLDTSGVIKMCHRGNVRPRHIQKVNPPNPF